MSVGRRAIIDRAVRGAPLSEQELAIVHLVGEGLTDRMIARRLLLSETTIKTHLTALKRKLGARNRAQAAVTAVRQGLI